MIRLLRGLLYQFDVKFDIDLITDDAFDRLALRESKVLALDYCGSDKSDMLVADDVLNHCSRTFHFECYWLSDAVERELSVHLFQTIGRFAACEKDNKANSTRIPAFFC